MAAIVAAMCLALLAPSTVSALVFENQFTGEVVSFTDVGGALAAMGVGVGATVNVTLRVDSEEVGEPAASDPQLTSYDESLVDIIISIGNFQAVLDPEQFSLIIVADNFSVPGTSSETDSYSVSGSLDTTNDVLGEIATVSLSIQAFDGKAIPNDAAAQDLSKFDFGSVAVVGGNGELISAILDLGGLPPTPTLKPPKCPGSQVLAGAALCKATLACYSKLAKNQGKDLDFSALDACIAKAEAKFAKRFDKAAKKGGCNSVVDGEGAADALAPDVDPLTALVLDRSDPGDKNDSKYRASILRAASKTVGKALKAEGKEAKRKKRRPEKLEQTRDKLDERLVRAIDKAAGKAEKKGLTPDVDPQAVVNAVNALVNSVLDVANGVDD